MYISVVKSNDFLIPMKFIFTILFFLIGYYLFAQTSISGNINSYAQVNVVYYSCPDSLLVNNVAGFSAGDSILIVQMQGAVIDTSNTNSFGSIINYDKAGNYELVKINSISGNTIQLTSSLIKLYDVTGNVQIVSYPNYTKAIVNGTLTAPPWNGSTGGILAFSVSDSLILNADIDLSGSGFKGGNVSSNYSSSWIYEYCFGSSPGSGGEKGEGVTAYILNKEYGRGAQANGGGGGMDVNTGGGGGGNYGSGGHGGNNYLAPDTIWGLSGISLDSGFSQSKIFLGGGGGGGQQDNGQGTSGGSGGGIIFIRATVLTGNNFTIKSNGMDVTAVAGMDGAGGGGAGGCVLLNAGYLNTNLTIEAKGGRGGDQIFPPDCIGNGGGGGGGIIHYSDSLFPSNVTTNISGGPKGIGLCNFTTNDAADGDSGTVKYKWSAPKIIVANGGPDVSICAGFSYQLGTAPQAGMQYQWDNGATGAFQTINPLADTSFILTVTDGFCHYSYDTVSIGVYPLPVPSFTFNLTCNTILFNNTSGINTYKWFFGDGDSSTTINPSHTYLNDGNYSVDLTVSNNNNCSTNVSQNISVNSNQQPALGYSNGTCDSVFHFTNQSLSPIASRWKFGDGDTSNVVNPYHTYSTPGNRQVQLITTSQNGCIDTVNQNVLVAIHTPAKFDYFIDSCAAKILFSSKSPLALSYNWDFGDNKISSLKNPIHSYESQGQYNVLLTVNENTACPASIVNNVNAPADGLYTLYIPNSFTPNGDGINDVFKITSFIPCDSYTLIIYNRWGEEVFKTYDPLNVGWDGVSNGLKVSEGVYTLYLQGTQSQKTGFILVTR